MPIELPDPALATEASQLARCVGQLAEQLESGEEVDLNALCADCPQYREQLEMLLPTLQAVVDLDRSLPLAHSPELQSPVSSLQSSLGDFRILRELGRGGMGVVYEAEQISLGRRVALKVLPFAAMLDKQQLARFKNEARAAATLDHPNIVQVFSVGVERGVHYYAMQLIEGESLAQVIARLRKERGARGEERGVKSSESGTPNEDADATIAHNSALDTQPVATLSTLLAPRSSPLAPSPRDYFCTIARLGVQAAEALDHAHQNGILHRDVKPANLMVEAGDCPLLRSPRSKRGLSPSPGSSPSPERDASPPKLWITDFGLARLEADAGMTMTGDLVGTLRYMSPEQALAKRVVVDHRSDVYSLGATLYELLTLQPPFDGDDHQELLKQIAFDEPKSPRLVDANIPRDLETIVFKTLEKNPSDRYATAQDVANDLRNFLEDRPLRTRRPTVLQHARKWVRRHQAVSAVAAISFMVLLAVTSAFLADRWRLVREGNSFVGNSLQAALAAMEAGDVAQAQVRLYEAQVRIDANSLSDPKLIGDVGLLVEECKRYAQFQQLVKLAHRIRSSE